MDPVQTRPLFRAALEAADAGVTELAKHWLERRNYRVIGPFTASVNLAELLDRLPADKDIDFSDIPEATEEWFKKAKRIDPA